MFYAVIMAGGSGTRLWPLSRVAQPKQVLRLHGEHTMIEDAVARISPLFNPEQILIVTRADHVAQLSALVPAIPAENFIVEPVGRGTAPAIGLAAVHLAKRDPEAVMAVLTADHVITRWQTFCEVLDAARAAAQQGRLVTLGIKPSEPATGYGYIHVGQELEKNGCYSVHAVSRFVEKPGVAAAQKMFDSGHYLFNSGMFVWQVSRILQEFEVQMPGLYRTLADISSVLGTVQEKTTLARVWPVVEKQTIDYGIMENARDVVVIPVDIGWTDVGSWESIPALLEADEAGNTVVGRHMGVDTRNTLVFNDSQNCLVATIGLDGLVVVVVDDAVLVCAKDRAQDVREIVRGLEREQESPWL